jgi:deoxyribodipyrimidine photo-lyase
MSIAVVWYRADLRLGDTYPEPIVDHAAARNRAIAAYQAAGR